AIVVRSTPQSAAAALAASLSSATFIGGATIAVSFVESFFNSPAASRRLFAVAWYSDIGTGQSKSSGSVSQFSSSAVIVARASSAGVVTGGSKNPELSVERCADLGYELERQHANDRPRDRRPCTGSLDVLEREFRVLATARPRPLEREPPRQFKSLRPHVRRDAERGAP